MDQPADPIDRTEQQIAADERGAEPQANRRRDDEAPAVRDRRIPNVGKP
jgi:hypothetical protein